MVKKKLSIIASISLRGILEKVNNNNLSEDTNEEDLILREDVVSLEKGNDGWYYLLYFEPYYE